jgi:NAD(P)-dependent dehydrogenase (short-subunit alcohol dehydrogenase family)
VKAAQACGPIQVVVNNAGIMPLSSIAKGDVETFDKVIAINLRGAFLVLGQAASMSLKVAASLLCRAAYWPSRFRPTDRDGVPPGSPLTDVSGL